MFRPKRPPVEGMNCHRPEARAVEIASPLFSKNRQLHFVIVGELRGAAHEVLRDRERRAGRDEAWGTPVCGAGEPAWCVDVVAMWVERRAGAASHLPKVPLPTG